MNRKTAIAIIRTEYATHGKATRESTRAYVETRIGFDAYHTAMRAGMGQYKEAHNNE